MGFAAATSRRRSGFTLLEIAMVLLILGILLAITGTTTAAYLNGKRRSETQAKLTVLDTAIANFVSLQKRLPCPADGTINAAAGGTNAGLELTSGTSPNFSCALAGQQNGVVPWVSLGLTLNDGSDSWGNVFTYRVDTYSVAVGSMDFTYCSGAGGAIAGTSPAYCNTLCSSSTFPLSCTSTSNATLNRGLRVKNLDASGNVNATPVADPCISTGAAYVLISHGENQEGAYTQTGTLIASGSTPSGTQEAVNAANTAFTPITQTSCSGTGSYLVDNVPNYNTGITHFDDFVSRPTLLTVAGRATLSPRAY